VNVYALLWTLVSLCGVLLSVTLLAKAGLDLWALGRLSNGRRSFTLIRIGIEAIHVVCHGAFLLVGAMAVGRASGPLSPTIVLLIMGNVGFVATSLLLLSVYRMPASDADDLVARARQTAKELIATAETTAAALVEIAALKDAHARVARDRTAIAAEQTAENTARIAENTARDDSP
jgi:hypothetical protein